MVLGTPVDASRFVRATQLAPLGNVTSGTPDNVMRVSYVSGSPSRLATLDGFENSWARAAFASVSNVLVEDPTEFYSNGQGWDLGENLFHTTAETTNFTPPDDPDFNAIGYLLTDGISEWLQLATWESGGGGTSSAAPESYWLHGNPDLVGSDVDFIRLVIHDLSFTPVDGGTQVLENYTWEIWGHSIFVAFYPPTDPNGTYLIDRRFTNVNVSLAEPGTAVLEWNGVNLSMDGTGTNWRPALTYESDSKAVFVFWIGQVNGMSSRLLFTSYRDGKWAPAVSIDDQQYTYRYNLRIAITRHVSTLQPDGSWADAPALLVHAVWWEDAGGNREKARYALFTIENSRVTNYEIHDLLGLAQIPDMAYAVDEKFNSEILRHPAIIEGTNSVDVIFGDSDRMSMNRLTLKPIADGRIHIPIGTRGGRPFPPPQSFSAAWTGRISTIGSGPDLVMYNTTRDATGYVMYSNGKWSEVRTLPLSENFSADAAAAALYKMLTAQQ